ncbi:MAG: hypothetical protein ABEJ98_00985 [Candidatus Nanohaloarchaea archaeon]
MRAHGAAIIVVTLAFLAAPAFSITDTGCIGSCDGTVNSAPCTLDPDISCPSTVSTPMCTDSGDNDTDQSKDGLDDTDLGCVKPYSYDWIEGNIWDADLTSLTAGGNTPAVGNTESVFFQATLHQGNDDNSITVADTSTSTPEVTEYYIKDRGSEATDRFGFGKFAKKTLSGFPSGTVEKTGRVVDPPNPDGSVTCGDGKTNEGEDTLGSFSIDAYDSSTSINCRKDYGRLHDEQAVESPYMEDSLQCRDDKPYCTTEGYTSNAGCEIGGCGETDYSSDESNYYWLVNADGNTEDYDQDSCEGGGSTSTSCSDQQEGSYTCSCGKKCTTTCYYCSSVSYTCSAETRAWDKNGEPDDEYNCDNENLVDGGGDSEGRSTDSMADNDPAGTWTDYRAFGDNTRNEVWCQAHKTRTVDADGPRGYGDGFVIIENGQVTGKMSPDGSQRVGERVWFREETLNNGDSSEYRDYTYKIEAAASCPGEKNVCIAYADFYTEEGDGSRGSPAWGGDTDWSSNNMDDAVEADVETFSLGRSYSACKMVNYIEENDGDADNSEVVDCDFERGSDGSEDVSPLSEACGDEPQEHLLVMEGYEVEYQNVKTRLQHAQKCVDWKEDRGFLNEGLDGNACLYRGRAYAEGTVINIKSPNADRYEKGDRSPDREVCVDPDGTGTNMRNDLSDDDGEYQSWDNTGNDVNGQDYGGEWYDLDNEMLNDYLNDEGYDLITGGDSGNAKDIAYFWGENPNPYHSEYNPTGGEEGIALEDDCGPGVNCDDTDARVGGKINEEEGLFYSFFSRLARLGQDGN